MRLMRKLVWSKLKSTLGKQRRKEKAGGSGRLMNKSNVNEEYVEAFRSRSYVEIYNKVQVQLECGNLGHVETTTEFPESSLQLHPLILNYFDVTLEACRVCELLLQSVQETRVNYRKIRKAIRLMKTEPAGSSKFYGVYRELASFASFNNPFSVVNRVQFLETRDGHDLLLQKLTSKFRRANRRIKFLKCCKKVLGISVAIGYTGVIVGILVLMLHSMVCLVAAPGVIASSFELFKKRFKMDKKEGKIEVLIAQLDVAAKGVYILINDFDTMSRLVRRLYDEIEHNRSVAGMCARRENGDMLKEVMKDFRFNKNCFLEQLKELEEHVCLCFLTINRSRKMVLQEMDIN